MFPQTITIIPRIKAKIIPNATPIAIPAAPPSIHNIGNHSVAFEATVKSHLNPITTPTIGRTPETIPVTIAITIAITVQTFFARDDRYLAIYTERQQAQLKSVISSLTPRILLLNSFRDSLTSLKIIAIFKLRLRFALKN